MFDIQLSGGNLNDSSDILHSIPFNFFSSLGSHVHIPIEVSKENPIGHCDKFTLKTYSTFFSVAVRNFSKHIEVLVEFDLIV